MNNLKKIILVLFAVVTLFGGSNDVQAATIVFSGSASQLVSQYGNLLQQDGVVVGNSGIYAGANGKTLDHICQLIDPSSNASYWKSDDYTSPGNNSIVLWNGFSWEKHGAKNYNNHLTSNLTCTTYTPPAPVNYAAYCGDGILNQVWEQCDGGGSCTSQCLDSTSNQCVDLILARVNITDVDNNFNNHSPSYDSWGGGGGLRHPYYKMMMNVIRTAHAAIFGGDMTSDIFVGNSLNRMPQGTWFPLYYNGSYYNDPVIGGYEDVPGIAIQRAEGVITTLMHGSHANGGSEHVEGNIEVWNANITTQANNISGNNRFEEPTDGVKNFSPIQDEYWKSGGKSFFWSTVTVQDDSFFTYYNADTPICVAPLQPTLSFTALPETINVGNSASIVWNATNVTSCSGTNFSTGGAVSGSVQVSPIVDTTYEISCTGSHGSIADTDMVYVLDPNDPTVDLVADSYSVDLGDGVLLTWDSENANSCTSSDFTTGGTTDGTATVYPTVDTTYEIDCDGATDEVNIYVVLPNVVTVNLDADPNNVDSGDPVELAWTSTNATVCASTDFNTLGATSGTVTVNPTVDTTYGVSCTGPGGTDDDTALVTINTGGGGDPAPSCTLEADPRNLTTGGTTELTWTSTNATSGSIDNGIGSISSVDNGDIDATPADTVTYTATFTGPGGTTTCSEEVTVDSVCTTCGGGGGPPFDPHISLNINDNPGEQPLAFVSLSQIPYTGFEAGPFVTTLFWLIMFAISAIVGHFIVSKNVMQKLMTVIMNQMNLNASNMTQNQSNYSFSDDESDSGDEVKVPTNLSGLLETKAHEENILISSEGLNIVIGLGGGTEHGSFEMLDTLLTKAKDTYPREDGWILLNTKRVHNLLPHTAVSNTEDKVEEKEDEVQAPTEKVEESVVEQKVENLTANDFIESLVSKNSNNTFDILRSVESSHKFITEVVCVLDGVYKHRLEGDRQKDEEAVGLVKEWSDKTLGEVLEILADSVDHSYSSNRIGAKVALTKVFKLLEGK